MKKILIFLLLLTSQAAFAALAPLNQSILEIKQILESKELNFPTSERIEKIIAKDKGYLLITANHKIFVEVRHLPQNRPGPQRFELIFHDLSDEN